MMSAWSSTDTDSSTAVPFGSAPVGAGLTATGTPPRSPRRASAHAVGTGRTGRGARPWPSLDERPRSRASARARAARLSEAGPLRRPGPRGGAPAPASVAGPGGPPGPARGPRPGGARTGPVRGSSSTSNSASLSSTPRCSRARSLASSSVGPVISTHSTAISSSSWPGSGSGSAPGGVGRGSAPAAVGGAAAVPPASAGSAFRGAARGLRAAALLGCPVRARRLRRLRRGLGRRPCRFRLRSSRHPSWWPGLRGTLRTRLGRRRLPLAGGLAAVGVGADPRAALGHGLAERGQEPLGLRPVLGPPPVVGAAVVDRVAVLRRGTSSG